MKRKPVNDLSNRGNFLSNRARRRQDWHGRINAAGRTIRGANRRAEKFIKIAGRSRRIVRIFTRMCANTIVTARHCREPTDAAPAALRSNDCVMKRDRADGKSQRAVKSCAKITRELRRDLDRYGYNNRGWGNDRGRSDRDNRGWWGWGNGSWNNDWNRRGLGYGRD